MGNGLSILGPPDQEEPNEPWMLLVLGFDAISSGCNKCRLWSRLEFLLSPDIELVGSWLFKLLGLGLGLGLDP